jgi:protein-S-isoprenylcysteine O-methyltransferase Ste14
MSARASSKKRPSYKKAPLQIQKERLMVASQRVGKLAVGLAEKHEIGEKIGKHSFLRSPEMVFGTALVLGIILELASPLYFHAGWSTGMRIVVGLIPLGLGTALSVLAVREFARANQSIRAGRPTTRLVRKGVYAYTRNPLYIGLLLAFLGLAITLNMPWWLVLWFPLAPAVHFLLVIPEERRLAEYFGPVYAAYADTVCRWVCPATFGMRPEE